MPIRDQALAAYEAERQSRVDAALARLSSTVLAGADGKPVVNPKTLTVAHEDHDAGLFVFTDGDVALGVHPSSEDVNLVEQVDGRWTRIAGPLATLADLGAALAAQEG